MFQQFIIKYSLHFLNVYSTIPVHFLNVYSTILDTRSAWIPLNTLLNNYEALFVITLYLRPPLSNATAHMSFYGIYSSIHLFALTFKHFVTLQASHQTSTGFNNHKVTSVFAQPPFSSVASICWLQSASCTTNAQEEGNHQHVLWQM